MFHLLITMVLGLCLGAYIQLYYFKGPQVTDVPPVPQQTE